MLKTKFYIQPRYISNVNASTLSRIYLGLVENDVLWIITLQDGAVLLRLRGDGSPLITPTNLNWTD